MLVDGATGVRDGVDSGLTLPEPGGSGTFARRHLDAAATAVAVMPFVASAVFLLLTQRGFAPYADIALIELGVRDVGRHLVLLGVYSRFGWRHPGPLLFYVLAVPYWLSGGSSIGLCAGAALINGASVVAIAWFARRRGGRELLLLTLLLVALMARTLGPELWADPWNPSLALFPLMAFVFGCWSLADGDDAVIPMLVVTGTFCVQTHVGYAMFVAVPLLVAVASRTMISRSRRKHDGESSEARPAPGRLRRALLWGAGIGVLLWLPPMVDQLIHEPGNLRELASFLRSADSQYGVRDGLQFTAYELGAEPAWLFGEHQAGWLGLVDYSSPPFPAGGVLLMAAGAWAVWRRDWSGTRLAVLAIGLLATSVISVSRIVEGLFPYIVRWSAAVGAFAWLAILWLAWRAVRHHIPKLAQQVAGWMLGIGLLAVSTANVWAGATTPPHDADKSHQIQALTAQLTPHLDKSRPVAVDTPDPTGGVEALFMLPAVALQLERQGYEIRVDDVRFQNRNSTGDEPQTVSIHHVSPDAPTVPALAARTPTATQDDFIAWVTRPANR